MSEFDISALKSVADNVLTAIKEYGNKIISIEKNVNKLPDLVDGVRKDINAASNRQIQALGEMQVYSRMANMYAKKGLLRGEKESLDDVEKQLIKDYNDISSRYDKIQKDLNEDARQRIREIDQHLLDLYDDNYPKDMYDGFDKKVIPQLENLDGTSMLSYEERMSIIEQHMMDLREQLRNFLDQRHSFFSNVHNFIEEKPVKENETYILPIWIVEAETMTGRQIMGLTPADIQVPSQITSETNPHWTMKTADEFADYQTLIENNIGHISNQFKWRINASFNNKLIERFMASCGIILSDGFGISHLKQAIRKAMEESNVTTII